MKPLLASEHGPVLAGLADRGTLLAFDYDGTLAPIVNDPGAAQMRAPTRERLRRLALLHPVAIVTGRSRLNVLPFLRGLQLVEVIGNHGSEVAGTSSMRHQGWVADWRPMLERAIAALPGVWLEDKRYSLTLHYRASTEPDIEARLRALVEPLPRLKVIGGKQVLNLVPEDAPDKGIALQRLCARLGTARALYVGDDETDEAVFRLRGQTPVVGVRIGNGAHSAAEWSIPGQADIDTLLDALLGAAPA